MRAKHVVFGAILTAGLLAGRVRADDAAPATPPAAAAKPGITLINLHLQQAMPQDVFDAIAKQAGVKFTTMGNFWDQQGMQTENDIDMTDRPFWSAVNEVCGLWGISPQANNFGGFAGNSNAKRIQLNFAYGNGPRTNIPAFESGGFLVQAMSFSRQQSVNYAMPQQSQDSAYVQLMVFVDPSIHIVSLNQSPKVEKAVDDTGNSMVPDKSNNMFYGGNQQRSLIYQCMVPLKYPDNPGKNIADLKFTLSMRGSDSLDSLIVDKPLDAAEASKEFGDTTVTFHSMKKTGNGMYVMKIGIGQDVQQGGGNGWNLLQGAELLDAKGHSFSYAGGGGGGGGQDGMEEYTVNYNANGGMQGEAPSGEPAKWVLELPTKTHAIKLPVEFKDLPLP